MHVLEKFSCFGIFIREHHFPKYLRSPILMCPVGGNSGGGTL